MFLFLVYNIWRNVFMCVACDSIYEKEEIEMWFE